MVPTVGVHFDVAFAEYLAWEAISNSRLGLARKSLRHYREAVWREATPAMRLGSLVHCGRLEPLAVAERYVVMPEFEHDEQNRTKSGDVPSSPRSTGYYKDKVREFERINADKEVVTREQYDKMLGMVRSIARDERAAEWLNSPGYVEVSIAWVDEESGLLCKARIDHVAKDWSRVSDLKTTENAQKFANAIADYGYHRQMAHYSNGVNTLGLHNSPECCLVAVESSSPFCTRSAPMHEEDLVTGRQEASRLLIDISEAKQTGDWPGYESPAYWRLPSWYDSGDAVELFIQGESIQV